MKNYVQVKDVRGKKRVVGVQASPGEITALDYFEIANHDPTLLGKERKTDGTFIDWPDEIPVKTKAEQMAARVDTDLLESDNTGKAIKAIMLQLGLIE